MPADFLLPVLTSTYANFLSYLKERDVDALTLCISDPSNIPANAMKWHRAASKFQEYVGGVWEDKTLSLVGGGTGATTAAGGRAAFGLGTMSTQDANAVAITGGSIAGTTAIGASRLTSETIAQARLGTGSDASGLHALFDDQTYKLIQGVPVGTGSLWYTNTPPTGYLLCDGTSLDRTTFAALFAVIGTVFGSVDGTHFNLPDLRQRFPLGRAASGTGNTLAATGGLIDHTHTSAAHTHPVTGAGTFGRVVDGTFVHTNGVSGLQDLHSVSPGVGGGASQDSAVVTGNTSSTTPGATGLNNPPYLVINYIIKT